MAFTGRKTKGRSERQTVQLLPGRERKKSENLTIHETTQRERERRALQGARWHSLEPGAWSWANFRVEKSRALSLRVLSNCNPQALKFSYEVEGVRIL